MKLPKTSKTRGRYNSAIAKKALTLIVAMSAFTGALADEMPTDKELSEVKPLVVDLMRPFVRGYNNKTKSAAEVGDTAVGLAKEAKTTAAKYLLLTGAIDFYGYGREYEKAADTIESLMRLVPDIPVNILYRYTSRASKGATREKAPRLFNLNKIARWRVNVAERLKTIETALKVKPADAGLMQSHAELTAAAGDWKAALKEFAKLGGKTGKMAQAESDETAPNGELADFWWDYKPAEPLVADAIAGHAAMLYKKAIDFGEVEGLKKVVAERRAATFKDANLPAPSGQEEPKYAFDYKLDKNGNAVLRYPGSGVPSISPRPEGILVVPGEIDGHKVVGFDDSAFINCDKMTRLVLPEHLENFGRWTVHGCIALERIDCPKDNPRYVSIDGALYTKDKRTLVVYPKTRKDVSLVPGCKTISDTAFSSCCFTAAKMPSGVEYAGFRAFDGCGELEIVEFPESFRGFNGPYCFLGCSKLRIVRFLGDAPHARDYTLRNGSGKINFLTSSPAEIAIEVVRGSRGWNGPGSTALPERWPSGNAGNADTRPIRYAK